MTDADVWLTSQPRIDTVVTGFTGDDRRLRTDHAGVAWVGDRPDPGTGMMGPVYRRRRFDSRLFLPDTHWYDLDALADVDHQVSVALLQVPGTSQRTQGLVGAVAEPVVEFYEHPEGAGGVGICLWLRGEIWSNLGLSYRLTVLCAPEAVIRQGGDSGVDETVTPTEHALADRYGPDGGGSDGGGGGGS